MFMKSLAIYFTLSSSFQSHTFYPLQLFKSDLALHFSNFPRENKILDSNSRIMNSSKQQTRLIEKKSKT